MTDTISRRAVIEAINSVPIREWARDEALKDAITAINAIPSQPQTDAKQERDGPRHDLKVDTSVTFEGVKVKSLADAMDKLIAQDADLINVATQPDSVAKSVVSLYRFDTENDRLRALEAIAVYKTRQSQTYAQIAGLLFKLDVAATTFEKVTTSEHREAVFNAEHAKLLRNTIKALWCEAVAETWGQGSRAHNVAQDGCDIVLAALKEK